jgi:sRNA-binding regulator protein Hfq
MSDFPEQYGKMKEPRRRKEKRDMNEKKEKEEEEEQKPRGFFEKFNGKNVEVRLLTKETVHGTLVVNRYNKFDVLVVNSEGTMLVPKHAVVYMVEKGERKNE